MDQRQAQVDIDRLSDRDKRDLQQSINNEMQKAKIQECTARQFPLFSLAHSRVFDLPPPPPPLPSLFLCPKALTNDPSSRARTHRHLLDEVRHGGHLVERAGPEGGALRAELRGEVLGRE